MKGHFIKAEQEDSSTLASGTLVPKGSGSDKKAHMVYSIQEDIGPPTTLVKGHQK